MKNKTAFRDRQPVGQFTPLRLARPIVHLLPAPARAQLHTMIERMCNAVIRGRMDAASFYLRSIGSIVAEVRR